MALKLLLATLWGGAAGGGALLLVRMHWTMISAPQQNILCVGLVITLMTLLYDKRLFKDSTHSTRPIRVSAALLPFGGLMMAILLPLEWAIVTSVLVSLALASSASYKRSVYRTTKWALSAATAHEVVSILQPQGIHYFNALMAVIIMLAVALSTLVDVAITLLVKTITPTSVDEVHYDVLIAVSTLGAAGTVLVISHWWLPLVLLPLLHPICRVSAFHTLTKMADEDRKTGLANSTRWRQLVTEVVSDAERERVPVAVLMCDLDNFKAINDTFGHLVGDEVIKEVATRVRTTIRTGDLVGRFGGEEFVVCLRGVDLPTAREIAEEVRRAIGEHPIPLASGAMLRATASIGVADAKQYDHVLDAILGAADTALYEAKGRGRNKVCIAKPAVSVVVHPVMRALPVAGEGGGG